MVVLGRTSAVEQWARLIQQPIDVDSRLRNRSLLNNTKSLYVECWCFHHETQAHASRVPSTPGVHGERGRVNPILWPASSNCITTTSFLSAVTWLLSKHPSRRADSPQTFEHFGIPLATLHTLIEPSYKTVSTLAIRVPNAQDPIANTNFHQMMKQDSCDAITLPNPRPMTLASTHSEIPHHCPGSYNVPTPLRKFANPGPLGLSSFATTTFLLSLFNVQTRGIHTENLIVSMAFAYGGIVQVLAGMWEFACGNTFGATAFSSYGGFWISFGLILSPSSGILAAYATKKDELESALGLYLFSWVSQLSRRRSRLTLN
ncbi:hypothetical protein PGT21_027457 [Puccinia graminis f. sp. tritici]|uniref:Acetate transporter n=1 Tax=Puccinia graminis f. sp. tritici TaxID=56615 RepID=A0A5B0QXE2_PUCGR|nr:hypothetical protein PGT21_027457 [Puccinia graminis f. sp. tritici]